MNKNRYEERNGFIVGFTHKRNNEFYFDKEDYDLVSKYYWKMNSRHDLITSINGKQYSMQHLLMGDGVYIHKNGNNNDNRRNNLISVRSYHNDGKTTLNGYIAIYNPEHPRAFDNGCVYEHILVAEEIIGRKLKDEECVHHIDRNRKNNDKSNLMVFATNSDHVRFHHKGAKAIQLNDGIYISIIEKKIRNRKTKICPICNHNMIRPENNMCRGCYLKSIK